MSVHRLYTGYDPAWTITRPEAEAIIEFLVGMLDDLDGDPDLEPSNGGTPPSDANPATVDAEGDMSDFEDGHDAEATNEDGGDINDQPHDIENEGDLEPEDFVTGYRELDAARFRTPDVRDAAAQVRRDLSQMPFRPRRTEPWAPNLIVERQVEIDLGGAP